MKLSLEHKPRRRSTTYTEPKINLAKSTEKEKVRATFHQAHSGWEVADEEWVRSEPEFPTHTRSMETCNSITKHPHVLTKMLNWDFHKHLACTCAALSSKRCLPLLLGGGVRMHALGCLRNQSRSTPTHSQAAAAGCLLRAAKIHKHLENWKG